MGAKKKAKREARKEEREYLFALVQQRVEERDTAWELNATQADTIGDLQKEVEATRGAWNQACQENADLRALVERCDRERESNLALIGGCGQDIGALRNELAELQNAHANQVASIQRLQSQVTTAEQEAAATRVALGLALKENRCLGEVVEARGQEIAALLKQLKDRETYYNECSFRSHRDLSRVLDESFVVDARLRTARALIANLHKQLEDKTHAIRAVRLAWAKDIFESERSVQMLGNSLLLAHEEIAQLGGDEK